MKKDSTGVKLGIAFGFLVSLLVGVGWLGLSRMGKINADMNKLFNQRWAKLQLARQVMFYSNSNYRITVKIVLTKNSDKTETGMLQVEREENRKKAAAAQKKIEAMVDSDAERELLAKVDEARGPSNKGLQKLFDLLASQGKTDEVREVMVNETFPGVDNYRDAWVAFVQYEENQLNLSREQAKASYETARQLSTFLILMAIVLAAGIAVFVTPRLTTEIQERERAKLAIRKLNEDLEKKVTERAEELARTVETL